MLGIKTMVSQFMKTCILILESTTNYYLNKTMKIVIESISSTHRIDRTMVFRKIKKNCRGRKINSSVCGHPPRSLALLKIEGVSLYSPCLFGKGIVVHARQTYIQQTKTFTKTKLI